MPTFTHYAMPMYTHDHATYIRQMHEWHMRMAHYHNQLRAHHLERAKHFHGLMGGGVTTYHPTPRPEELSQTEESEELETRH